MRRAWLRGSENLHKRYLVYVADSIIRQPCTNREEKQATHVIGKGYKEQLDYPSRIR